MLDVVQSQILGVLGLADTPRSEAKAAVRGLQKAGIDVYMITGDTRPSAIAMAKLVGIRPENVFAQVLPNEKAQRISDLQSSVVHGGQMAAAAAASPSRIVAMVGDGINDAPALAQADLGVALASGTNVSMEAADIVLVNQSLEDLLVMIDLSRKVLSRIQWNLFWALGYNAIGIPLAAGVLYPFTRVALPSSLAGLLMTTSSVLVVTSSLMIRFYKKPEKLQKNSAKAREKSSVGRRGGHMQIRSPRENENGEDRRPSSSSSSSSPPPSSFHTKSITSQTTEMKAIAQSQNQNRAGRKAGHQHGQRRSSVMTSSIASIEMMADGNNALGGCGRGTIIRNAVKDVGSKVVQRMVAECAALAPGKVCCCGPNCQCIGCCEHLKK